MQPPSIDVPKTGTVVAGRYLLEETLGEGGMGVVMAARHVTLRQRVAIKFLRTAALALPGAVSRFLREARASAAIKGDHVARVIDAGSLENGTAYMVMEHLSGSDLARVLRSRPLVPVEDAIDIVLQACEALSEAHSLGIVHRDLKPANLFITQQADGSSFVKVLDFGLSKITSTRESSPELEITETNVVAGSPHYMSPEQVRSLKQADARTDVWALGVILYEMVTGQRPFRGQNSAAVLAAVVADAPIPPRSLRPDIEADLDRLILRLLLKDPSSRVQSVAEMARCLGRFSPSRSGPSVNRICRFAGEPEIELSAVAAGAPPIEPPPVAASAPPVELPLAPPAADPRRPASPPDNPPRVIYPEPTQELPAPASQGSRPSLRAPEAWGRTTPPLRPTRRAAAVAGAGAGAALLLAALAVWSIGRTGDHADSPAHAATSESATRPLLPSPEPRPSSPPERPEQPAPVSTGPQVTDPGSPPDPKTAPPGGPAPSQPAEGPAVASPRAKPLSRKPPATTAPPTPGAAIPPAGEPDVPLP